MGDGALLRQGSVVWVPFAPDAKARNPKERAFIILNATGDIRGGMALVGVAVSGTFREPLADHLVKMRWHPSGNVETGFRKACCAVCNWLHRIPLDENKQFVGTHEGRYVRRAELDQILTTIKKLTGDIEDA